MLDSIPAKDKPVERKFTLYINTEDRTEIDKLRAELSPTIATLPNRKDYMDTHDHLSVAGMFRYLRHQEMERRGISK